MWENIDLETLNRIGARENSCMIKRGHKPESLDCG